MSRVVVACYKPKPDHSEDLKKLVRTHHKILKEEGFATAREPVILLCGDQTLIEIYEITDTYCKERTDANFRVMELWRKMDCICTYVPPGRAAEMQTLFPAFEVIE